MEVLGIAATQRQLGKLNETAQGSAWVITNNDHLHKQFVFANFIEAFGFMTRAAIIAETMNHHPEWSNVYRKVDVNLTTHEAGGLTELDFELAARMEQLLAQN